MFIPTKEEMIHLAAGMIGRYQERAKREGMPLCGKINTHIFGYTDYRVVDGVEYEIECLALEVSGEPVMLCQVLPDGELHEIGQRYWPPDLHEIGQRDRPSESPSGYRN